MLPILEIRAKDLLILQLTQLSRLIALLFVVAFSSATFAGNVSGELAKWHPIEIDFSGPFSQETNQQVNPFLDYRLDVSFIAPNGESTLVPGFFAGDGQGNGSGNVWRVRFSADQVGRWSYRAVLKAGTDVAVASDEHMGTVVNLTNDNGQFDIGPAPANAPLFLRHGRLEYVGEHYLKFRDGPYWIKTGTDSPENLLAFDGIDGTIDQGGVGEPFLHSYSAHREDWNETDPFFTSSLSGADSKGLIGALNYLGKEGVNSVYFLPMNLGGDGQDTYPFVGAENTRFNKTHYDISKLYQWNTVLNHAQRQGIALNIVLSETEPENELWLDNGEHSVERKLFFRELVARFGYLLAVKWNLGEENDFPRVELDKQSAYLQSIDWSDKPIAVHTHINQFFRYGEIVGDPRYSASSIQYDPEFAGQFVEQWRDRSRATGHPWVIDMDENTNGLSPDTITERRKEVLYDVLFSGGNIEWYYGYNPLPIGGDLDAEDFRIWQSMWRQMRFAREMMEAELPFWRMSPADSLVSDESSAFGGAEVFAASGEVYAIYLPQTNGIERINLSNVPGRYEMRWFNPRTAEYSLKSERLNGGASMALGQPPAELGEDWVVLLKRERSPSEVTASDQELLPEEGPRFINIPNPTLNAGDNYSVTLTAVDNDGHHPSVTADSLPAGMGLQSYGAGQLVVTWQVPLDWSGDVTFNLVAIRAVDSAVRNSQTMTIHVNPHINPQADAEANAGANTQTVNHENTQTILPTEQDSVQTDSLPTTRISGAPVLHAIPNFHIRIGQTLVHRVQAEYTVQVPPSLMVWNAPAGSEFRDNGDGSRTFLWAPSASDIGIRTLTFVAEDSQNPELTHIIDVEVLVTL